MRLSAEDREQMILSALGDGEMTVSQLQQQLPPDENGWLWADTMVRAYLERLRLMGTVSREPTGKYRPRWRYFKTERPLKGKFAEIVKELS